MELEISNLKKTYRNQSVLDIPELTIKKGELVGLVGNNGAGKTTLFRLMMDLIRADNGQVLSRGLDVSRSEHWKTYTSGYIDQAFLIEFLTPEEYFDFIAANTGINTYELQQFLSSFKAFMNGEILGKKKYIRDFSAGNQQKIGIIGALVSKPEILLLDEPFNFLDPTSQHIIRKYLVTANKKDKMTIVISSHNIDSIFSIGSRAVLLEKGKIILDTGLYDEQHKTELYRYFTHHERQ